tara:strand:- start:46 stop:327 length:282 start_codon:yes stop_codon:yes gene_type:complete
MVLFYLTNSLLDISAGVLWWIGKKTTGLIYDGISYAIYSNDSGNDSENDYGNQSKEINKNYDSLSKEDIDELLELKNEIKDLKALLVQNKKNK